MRSWRAISWFSSMLILTSLTAPFASFTTFSSAGPSVLQGPHHGAQKSTMTGTSREASSTSAAKVSSEESLILGAEAGAAGALPSWAWRGAGLAMGRPEGSIRGMDEAFLFCSGRWSGQRRNERGRFLTLWRGPLMMRLGRRLVGHGVFHRRLAPSFLLRVLRASVLDST